MNQAPVGVQKMADLPADRVTHGKPPFSLVGVDCFGPFIVRRGRSQVKRYGVLYTCLVTRAIHIEVVQSMATDSFVNSMRRFVARGGLPEMIPSDNCSLLGEQGWCSGESACLPPLWPGFDSRTWRHMWVEFVVGSRSCSEGFSPGSPVFLPPQKPTRQIPIRPGNSGHIATSWKCHC